MERIKNTTGKILSVDFGDVRTGLAISDPSRFLASGIGYISPGGLEKTAEAVAAIAKEQKAVAIVVGLPKNMDGSEGESAQNARNFAKLLEEMTGIKTVMQDERGTTITAHNFLNTTNTRGKKRKNVVDEVAATIILQNFLDKRKNAARF